MEEKKINNYAVLLANLEKMIKDTKRDDVRNYLKELYESFIIEIATTEKKEIHYYEEKLRNMEIDEKRIEEVTKKINAMSSKTKIDDNLITYDKTDEEIQKYITENIINSENEQLKNKYIKLINKLEEDLKNPNDLAINTWLKNYIEFASFYEKNLDRKHLMENVKILFKTHDKEKKYIDNLNDIINTILKDSVAKFDVPNIDASKKNNSNSSLEIRSIKRIPMSKDAKKILNTLAITSKNNKWKPKSIICYIIYKFYRNKKLTNEKLIEFMRQNGYLINENNELIDKNGNLIDKEYIEREKASYLKNKLIGDHDVGEIPDNYKKNKITSMLLNMKIIKSLKKYSKNSKNKTIKDNENVDIIKGMGKC